MGVVVRRYIDILIIIITFPYSTCINSFFDSNIPTSLFINFFYIYHTPRNIGSQIFCDFTPNQVFKILTEF